MNPNEQSPWHAGERQIQASAGAAERMAVIGPKVIRDHLPEQHRDFYPLLPYLILGVVDEHGIPWATLLEGAPGFAHSPDPHTLQIDSLPSAPPGPLCTAMLLWACWASTSIPVDAIA